MTPAISNPSPLNSFKSSPPPVTRLPQLQLSDTRRVGRLSAPSTHVLPAENVDLNIGTAGGLRRPSTSDEDELILGDHGNLAGPSTGAQGLGSLAIECPGSEAPSLARGYATSTRDESIGRAVTARTDPLAAVGGQFATCYGTETEDHAGSLHTASTEDSSAASILDNQIRYYATSSFSWVRSPCNQTLACEADHSATTDLSSHSKGPLALIDGSTSWRDSTLTETGMDGFTNEVGSETGVLGPFQQDIVVCQAKAISYHGPSLVSRDSIITDHVATVSDRQCALSPSLQTPNTIFPPSSTTQAVRVGAGRQYWSTEVNNHFLQSPFNAVDLSDATAYQGPVRFLTRSSYGPTAPLQLPAQPVSTGSPTSSLASTASCFSSDGTLKRTKCSKIVSEAKKLRDRKSDLRRHQRIEHGDGPKII